MQYAPSQALPYFLDAADRLLGASAATGDGDVSARTRAAVGEPDERMLVEQCWLCYYHSGWPTDDKRYRAAQPRDDIELDAADLERWRLVLTKQIRPVTPRSRSRSRSPPPVPTAEELEHAMNAQRILDREANPHMPCGDSDDEYYNF